MNTMTRKILMACAIAALMTSPAWAAESDPGDPPGGLPEAETGQPMEGAPPAGAEPGGFPGSGAAGAAASNNPLYGLTPNELRRSGVQDPSGEMVGRIKTVVVDPDRERVHAVISSGGFLGIGARDVIVPFDELQLSEDKVQLSTTKEQLQERQQYTPEEYVELEPDRPISEFSAFEPAPDQPGSGIAPEPPPRW